MTKFEYRKTKTGKIQKRITENGVTQHSWFDVGAGGW
jgi:hypothetical protein